jgi:hypothetical protein
MKSVMNESTTESTPAPSTPTRQPAASAAPEDSDQTSTYVDMSTLGQTYLKGWNAVTDVERSYVKDVIVENDKLKEIVFTIEEPNMFACPNCSVPQPEEIDSACLACGFEFK